MKIPWYLMANGKGGGTKTASGPIAHWTDGVDAPLKSLLVNIDPVQDLHGYDNPWPAGGGKNKFDVDKMVNTSDITISNGVITVKGNSKNSTKKLRELADLAVGEAYILTANTAGSENLIYLYGTGANVSWSFGTSKTITQEMLDALVFFYGGSGTASQISNFMIRLSSVSDATYAPYSNICPISGWTEAKVWVKPTYDPTANPTATIQLGQTIYGATLDVLTGKLTVDRAMVDLGTLTWNKDENRQGNFYTSPSQIFPIRKFAVICSAFKVDNSKGAGNIVDGELSSLDSYGLNRIFVKDLNNVSKTDAEFGAAMSGVQLVYELATPIIIPLTPTQISSIVGENNVWADTGDVTVEYESSGGSDPNLMKLVVAFMGRR